MAVLDIKKYPEEVLKNKALPIESLDDGLQRLIDDMIETMYAAPGIGLAAPQVGVSQRLIVLDVSTREEQHPLMVLLNPEIVEADEFVDSEEGCLSIPGHLLNIKRAGRVVVQALDRNGAPLQFEARGLLAVALQHEIDHLEGVLIVDRISAIKREFFKKRYFKALKEAQLKV